MAKAKIHYNAGQVLKSEQCLVVEEETPDIKKYLQDYISLITKKYTGHIIDTNSRLLSLEYNVDSINNKLENIEKDIKLIKEYKTHANKVIVIREMDIQEAKKKILEYTEKHKEFDIEELHNIIGCNLETIIDVLEELKNEGRIEEVI